jgi:hypothetical protein
LIINYSFGHRNSTVMLTPYGGMVNYINHHKQKTNVKIRWTDGERVAHKPSWLTDKTPEDLKYTLEKIGLSFEYVATRDILEGEEVFMVCVIERCLVALRCGAALRCAMMLTLSLGPGLRRRMARSLG